MCVCVGGVVDDITDHPCMSAPFCPHITPMSGSEPAQPGTSHSSIASLIAVGD